MQAKAETRLKMVWLEETRKSETTRRVIVGERARLEKRGMEERPGWKIRSRGIGGCRSWTSRRHDAGDGTESLQAFGFCMWDCVLGAGMEEGIP